jgi:hypothetical protein
MRLAIIGAGNVGGTLGAAWAQKVSDRFGGLTAAKTFLKFPGRVDGVPELGLMRMQVQTGDTRYHLWLTTACKR